MKTTTTSCLLIVFISIASSAPPKPLNERPADIAWEAWLLVDQGNRQGNLGLVPRRITPKSVFIAPTFSPDSLPACAEGYKSDSMGRCVKIIKINESVQFHFLLAQLTEQFPDYVDDPEDIGSSGPFQVNIPLLSDEKIENDTDVAIVVTPSSNKHHEKTTTVKIDLPRPGDDKFNVENVAALLGVNPQDIEMTTMAELTTTTLAPTTTDSTETEPTTTTETTETTTVEGDAIFFLKV